jgi:hypothetical protein
VNLGWIVAAAVALAAPRPPSDLTGRVEFAGLAVPGAIVTVTQAERVVTTVSTADGTFRVANLPDGLWNVRVEMRGFATVARDVTMPLSEPSLVVSLTMKPYQEIVGEATAVKAPPDTPDASKTGVDDALILLGTVTNGAATPFAQPRAAGNNRPAGPREYSGSVSATLANSAWNAKPYSFGGASATADTGDVQLGFVLTGPLRLPWIVKHGPRMTLSLQRGVSSNAITQSARVPTRAERAGDFSDLPVVLRDPETGTPFDGNAIPAHRITPQAIALLAHYPLPNVDAAEGTNYQRPIVSTTRHLGGRFQTTIQVSRRNQLAWDIAVRRSTSTSNNLFDFINRRRQWSIGAGVTWTRTVSGRLQTTTRYQFTRVADTLTPHFAGRINVSGDAGISGNDQSPSNWGPPTLQFPRNCESQRQRLSPGDGADPRGVDRSTMESWTGQLHGRRQCPASHLQPGLTIRSARDFVVYGRGHRRAVCGFSARPARVELDCRQRPARPPCRQNHRCVRDGRLPAAPGDHRQRRTPLGVRSALYGSVRSAREPRRGR